MTVDSSNDWSEKMNKLASRSKELATKGLESSKKAGKSLASKSKNVAQKSLESSKKAGETLASKSKEVATKGVEGTKSAVESLSKSSHEFLEHRKEKNASGKNTSEFEVIPQSSGISVTEGEQLVSPLSEDYSKFTVHELKIRLKVLGLAVEGKKAALIERLKLSRKMKKQKDESSVLDDLALKIQRIEEEYPEVLKPLPPDSDEIYSQLMKNSFYYVCGFTLIIYSILLLLPAVLADRFGDSTMGIPFIDFFLPTWFSPEHIQPMNPDFHLPFVVIGALVVFSSGILLLQKKNFGTTLLWMYCVGILLIGRLVYFFQSDTTMVSDDYSNFLHDLFLTFIVCGFASLPRAFYQIMETDTPLHMSIKGDKSFVFGKKSNTDANIEQIIREGFIMDFRTEVSKPKTPRARAKFEAYEKILLIFGIPTWLFAVALTISYDDGLTTWIAYSANIQSLAAVWTIGLFILIALIRFDRAARGNGWYAKEKETYVGLMDLYNKAQAKHYEYVELRAAAEAQEILAKYPQLDSPKSSSASKA